MAGQETVTAILLQGNQERGKSVLLGYLCFDCRFCRFLAWKATLRAYYLLMGREFD